MSWLYLKQTFWAPEEVGTYVLARKLYASGVPLGWTPKTLGDSTTTRGVPVTKHIDDFPSFSLNELLDPSPKPFSLFRLLHIRFYEVFLS